MRRVAFKGNPLTLVGRDLRVGTPAPDFRVVTGDLKEVGLIDYRGKVKVITTVLSLDTPVCDAQVKEFNKKAQELSADTLVIGISKDLPFAQKRFCAMNEIRNVVTLSDYKYSSFGINYGLLVKELGLLARSILILDKNDILRYARVVEELTDPPDYADALKAPIEVAKNPAAALKEELPSRCKPCEEGTPSLPKEKIERLLAEHRGWELIEDKKILKEFKFKDFVEAKYFLDMISVIAEEQGHHPTLTLIYNKLKVTLTTHAAGGLTENDFIMARAIDEIAG